MFIDLSLPIGADSSATQANAREEALMRLGHQGTHLDRLLKTVIPLEYVRSRAVKFDVEAFSSKREVTLEDIPLERIQGGDFVIFHTGGIKRHGYGSRAYLDEYFEISWKAIDWLIKRKIRFIGVDARGIRGNHEHRQADELCEQGGVYVIENMNDTALLPATGAFTAYSFCFDLGSSGLPCRVIAET
jgi:kynurenine formamidase